MRTSGHAASGQSSGLRKYTRRKPVTLGPVGLDVPMPGVVTEVLGHGCVGVEPDFAEMEAAGVILGQVEQTRADPAALHIGPDRDVVQQQVAGLCDQDGKPDDLATFNGNPRLPAADRLRIVGGHRGRRLADPGDIVLVSRGRDAAERIHVAPIAVRLAVRAFICCVPRAARSRRAVARSSRPLSAHAHSSP